MHTNIYTVTQYRISKGYGFEWRGFMARGISSLGPPPPKKRRQEREEEKKQEEAQGRGRKQRKIVRKREDKGNQEEGVEKTTCFSRADKLGTS